MVLRNGTVKRKELVTIEELEIGGVGYVMDGAFEIANDGSVWLNKRGLVYQGLFYKTENIIARIKRKSGFLYQLDVFGPSAYKVTRISETDFELNLMNWVDNWKNIIAVEKIDTNEYFKVGQADLRICRGRQQ